jgi:two-component system, cell cycle response regulator
MNKIEQLRISGQLPSPKGVALAIMEISQREDATLDEVTRLVQADPALSSRLLRMANAASHGAANNGRVVVSINEAVLRMGMGTVRQLAMGFSLVDQYPQGACKTFDYPSFWSHSLFMAVASQELGRVVRVGTPDELFACGLLAQIGRLGLVTVYPADYTAILEMQASGVSLAKLERERLGVDHTEFTAAIMTDCGIPKALVEPVYYHEAPEASGFAEGSRPYQLAHLFFQARRMADLGLSAETERYGNISELMRLGGQIGLDAEALGEVFDRVVNEWLQWADLLKVPAGPLPSFGAMASAPVPRPEQEPKSTCKRVLLVEDEPTTRIVTENALRQLLGCTVFTAENGKDALALALEVMPQIVITDWLMPVMDGIDFCRALRASDWGQSMYVIMLTGVETEEKIVEAFEAGVDDYITKPMNNRALSARMRAALHYVKLLEAWEQDRAQLKQFAAELAISNQRLEHAAMTDLLTGLPNRRAGMEALVKAWSAASRSGQNLAVLMVDIDRFKNVNDTYGHAVGDQVLKEVSLVMRKSARKDDFLSRIGGEEFLLVCQNSDMKSTLQAAERLRHTVKSKPIRAGALELNTTISIGIACREAAMPDMDAMLAAADKALYASKQGGRDRTSFSLGGKLMCVPH